MHRRTFLAASAAVAASQLIAADKPKPVFRHRGYTIGTRLPTAGLAVW